MSPSTDEHRLFFALWPEQSLRAQIEQRTAVAVAASGGRPVASRNYHVTLLFIGNVGREGLERARSTAAALISPSFDLSFDRLESPGRAAVMWLGTQRQPAALEELVQGLRSSGLAVRQDQVFRPHVTLVRDPIRKLDPSTIDPVHWPARDFVLASSALSSQGSEYTVIGRWALGPP